MELVAMVCLAAFGSFCIYAGYRLFCDLPAVGTGGQANRKAVILLNIVPGVALALFGTALLTVGARAIAAPRPSVRRHEPPPNGAAWRRITRGPNGRQA